MRRSSPQPDSNRTIVYTLAGVTAVLVGVAFLPVFQYLYSQWTRLDDYQHAFLTVPIVLFMVWQKRLMLKIDLWQGTGIGLFIVIFSLCFYILALKAQISTLTSLSMILFLGGACIYLVGPQVIHILATPFLLFLLLVPVPSWLYATVTLPLQLKVSQVSEIIVRLLSIPVYREGNIISLPDKTFQIVQACSGMRSIMTLVVLSIILGYFSLHLKRFKLLLVALSIPAAIIVNIIRVVALIFFYYYFNLDLSTGLLHTILGMVVFLISFAILLLLYRPLTICEEKYIKS
jgi:exosortase